jgi:flagellar biosynthesis protein FlhG
MEGFQNKFWAIGGGKGGVGKTLVTLLLGAALARLGRKVVLVDADLGGANLHTFSGIRYPTYTLADFISRRIETLDEILMDTSIENMKLICGADDLLGIANPKAAQKKRLFNHLKKLEADIVLLDLGPGSSFMTLDFFLYAPNKIVVLTPQIPSIQNAYGFIKTGLYRGLQEAFGQDQEALELIRRSGFWTEQESIDSIGKLFEALCRLGNEPQQSLGNCLNQMRVKLLVNMVSFPHEKNVGNIVKSVAKNYLSLEIEELGSVQFDPLLQDSINKMSGILNNRKDGVSGSDFHEIAREILKNENHLITSS